MNRIVKVHLNYFLFITFNIRKNININKSHTLIKQFIKARDYTPFLVYELHIFLAKLSVIIYTQIRSQIYSI